jgi:hypothetical protein
VFVDENKNPWMGTKSGRRFGRENIQSLHEILGIQSKIRKKKKRRRKWGSWMWRKRKTLRKKEEREGKKKGNVAQW